MSTEIYIGTILLERNRWARGKEPTYLISEWLSRFSRAGFDGMELWENHAALASSAELAALQESAFPVAVFNSYTAFGATDNISRQEAARLATLLNARGVKFNLGREAAHKDLYVQNALAWREQLPPGTRLLCECHGGTIMEDPQVAKEVFAAWEDDAFQAIVHPFTTDTETLREWFAHLGPRITHAHVQLRDASGVMQRLDRQPKVVKERLHLMREEGFSGSFALEFTEGTGSPTESTETLFSSAIADLNYLREHLTW
jgi:sugar phosphate isomerase/epimerase